ncbi:uncharacterized protein MELLADRAFT_101608 [Melampsora larici-populina 98AG31]|uniref:Secreted protein n=1 Tax=Melampsora larici-populina (strain 98AG31 / pathotype 3-4-7) TaxID=747676 RepID=F4R6E2_MELLP|nr:uncharacterized protein MELLADRAFT_101608 [Melampsora larici-populina 98AG31]EGG12476.1 secreted protein [Melampsora larici-populina 98AG31]
MDVFKLERYIFFALCVFFLLASLSNATFIESKDITKWSTLSDEETNYAWEEVLEFYQCLGNPHIPSNRSPFRHLNKSFKVMRRLSSGGLEFIHRKLSPFREVMNDLDQEIIHADFVPGPWPGTLKIGVKGKVQDQVMYGKTAGSSHQAVFILDNYHNAPKIHQITMIHELTQLECETGEFWGYLE